MQALLESSALEKLFFILLSWKFLCMLSPVGKVGLSDSTLDERWSASTFLYAPLIRGVWLNKNVKYFKYQPNTVIE